MSQETTEHHQRGLKRGLGWIQAAALLFAGVGASGGVYSLWTFSYGTSGPPFFWAYPLVAAGVLVICLVWAELASQYPYAGTFYEWPRLVRSAKPGDTVAWWVGWLYLFGICVTATSVYPAIANAAITLFGWTSSDRLITELSVLALILSLAVNALGIDRVGKFGVIGVAGELVAVGVIVTLTMILGAHQSPSILVHLPNGQTFSDWIPGFLGAAAFMPIWALYTFEGAGLLGEETRDARNGAPKAILISFGATVGVAMYIILVFILTSKNPTAAMSAANPIADNINNALPNWCSKVYEFVVLEVLFLAASAVLTYASRQMYGMARARELPISGTLTKSLDNGVPIGSLIAVSILSGLPLLISSSIAVLIGGTSALMYVVYALMILLVVVSRFRGWPARRSPFSLGRYGMFVSIAALAVTIAIATDLLWPRDSTNPAWHLGIRAAYWMVGIPLLAGLILMFARPKAAVHVPDPVDALERSTPEEGLASGA